MSRLRFEFVAYKGNEEIPCSFPAKLELCSRCRGEGTHTNPSIDGNGITQSEMDELGEDFREDYMRGVYDVQCSVCKGKRVVEVPDISRWSFAQKRLYVLHLRAEREYAREDYSERYLRMAESGERW
jgi:hypothetical protein